MLSRRIVQSIRRNWWISVVAVVVGGAAGIVLTRLQTPEYSASAELFVSTTGGTSSTESFQGNQFSQQRTASYAYMITGEVLAQRVVDELGLAETAQEFAAKVTATVVPRTVLLDVAVTDPDADRAAQMANVLSAKFIEFAGPLETPVGQDEPRTTITIVSAAEPPAAPTSPSLTRNVALGLVLGLLGGSAVLFALALLSRGLRTVDDVEHFADVEALGKVTLVKRDADGRGAQLKRWIAHDANDFRRLKSLIEAVDPVPVLIVVTPGSRREPVARFGVDLGIAMAEAGRRTLVVGLTADFISEVPGFDLPESPGFAELAGRRVGLDEAVCPTPKSNFFLMTAGRQHADVVLSSPEGMRVLPELRQHFDCVIALTESVQHSGAAIGLARVVDMEILVVATRSPARFLTHAVSELRAVRAPLWGAVLVEG